MVRCKKPIKSKAVETVQEETSPTEEKIRLVKTSSNDELPELIVDVPDSPNIDVSKFCADTMRLYYGKYNVVFRTKDTSEDKSDEDK